MTKPIYDVEFLIEAAKQHGEDSEPDHEVGDLQEFLRVAYELMTTEQQNGFMRNYVVKQVLESALWELPVNYPK
jgi:hypothetical protein